MKIIEMVTSKGVVTVQELVQHFDVSDMTARRDLKLLEDEGRLLRTHGGAVSLSEATHDRLALRQTEHVAEKTNLARAAADLVVSGATIYLGTGSTVAAMVPFLRTKAPLTVVTPSLAVFEQLKDASQLALVLIGGHYLPETGCFVGESSEVQIAQYRYQVAFLGASGVHPQAGVFIGVPAIASLEKTALEASDSVAVLADSSKLGKSALIRVLELADLDVLVTDVAADSPYLPALRASTKVIRVLPTAAGERSPSSG